MQTLGLVIQAVAVQYLIMHVFIFISGTFKQEQMVFSMLWRELVDLQ